MLLKELALSVIIGDETTIVPFFPDISDWYKVKRLAFEQRHEIPTGSFISDDAPFHRDSFGMPPAFVNWTYLDFYRNFNWGLPVHIYDWCDFTYENCEYISERKGNHIIRQFRTPFRVMEHIDGIAADGSLYPIRHFIENSADWKAFFYVVEHTKPIPNYQRIRQVLNGIGELGIADIVIWRSPFGKIVNEYAGLETTAYQLADDPMLIKDLLQLQTRIDLNVINLAAESPADIVIISDHADEQIINPVWYEEYCLPFYLQANEILHAKGKIVSTHLDGNFKGLFELVKQSGFDLLDGCTPAPMTNYEVEELPLALTEDMRAYCGVPSIFFTQDGSIGEILTFAQRIVKALAGSVILNIGDILPASGDIHKAIELGKWIAGVNDYKSGTDKANTLGKIRPGSSDQGV